MRLPTANSGTRLTVAAAVVHRQHPNLTRQERFQKARAGDYETIKGQPVFARVDDGRWLADCSLCPGAELVEPGERMLCGSCGAVSTVKWPSEADTIESVLVERPVTNRFWFPGETVADLRRENIEHGLPEGRR